jgi:hypothetical protein
MAEVQAQGVPCQHTLTSLGVPYDITLCDLRVECFFPADAASEATLRGLAGQG